METIYLDYAAATPMLPQVLEKMLPYYTQTFGNPSSIHAFGRAARAALQDANDSIAYHLGCASKQIVFTSGGTESDNLALFGIMQRFEPGSHLITSQIEHHAVLHSCRQLEKLGYEVTYLSVDTSGKVQIEDVERAIRPSTKLISIMLGNNEVGTIQPVEAIGLLAHERKLLFHMDAVQGLGHVDINLSKLPVDFVSFSAHKIGGPKGIGMLYCSRPALLAPMLFGGTQEKSLRAGTENVSGIVGFAEAVRIAVDELPQTRQKLNNLRESMLQQWNELLPSGSYVVNGSVQERLPHILNVSFPGIQTETLLMNLDLEGVLVSSGSACTSGSLEVSHVLKAMHLADPIIQSAIRFSFGNKTSFADMQHAAKITATIVNRLRTK
jgi:cysteine desulfurase